MKIKKKTIVSKQKVLEKDKERKALYLVILIIVIVDVLLFLGIFPAIEDKIVSAAKDSSVDITAVSKASLVILIDIVLFVSLFMIISRMMKKRGYVR